jgi:hypothetical protein
MNTSQNTDKGSGKKPSQTEELKTEHPMSEKDEVKAAEARTAKLLKNEGKASKGKK